MEIICCNSDSDAAQEAFRLRYEVYCGEYNVNDPHVDHKNKIYTDPIDKLARIYVAMKEGRAIATVRSISDKDCNFKDVLESSTYKALGIDKFLGAHSGSLAFSERFAISPDSRGSYAAGLVTAKMYQDYLADNTNFVFSLCAPYLFDFYMQLGFHMYAESVCKDTGLLSPIVLPVRDWQHLKSVRSPLFKQVKDQFIPEKVHPSITWFYQNYSSSIDEFVSKCDEHTLEMVLELSKKEELDIQERVNIFNGMTETDVKDLIQPINILNISAGQEIIKNKQANDEMFIIIHGSVVRSLDESCPPQFRLSAGEAFGEISMLARTPRYGYYFASVDTKLAVISRQNLSKIMKTNQDLATKLLLNISKTLALKLLHTNV